MPDKLEFSPHQTIGSVLASKGRFRAILTDLDPSKHDRNIFVQEAVNEGGVGGWVDRGGYNSLSDDYAYTNARDDVERRAKRDFAA